MRLIVIDEAHNLLGERGGIVVSMSKLSVGVNVQNMRHVCIWSAGTNQVEIAQMLGGSGCKAVGICIFGRIDPPTDAAIAVPLLALPIETMRDLSIWVLLRQAAAPLLPMMRAAGTIDLPTAGSRAANQDSRVAKQVGGAYSCTIDQPFFLGSLSAPGFSEHPLVANVQNGHKYSQR
jgi:hypothetical protein